MSKSTLLAFVVKARSKPEKPYPDFPLFPHATGRWAKKVRGKLHYFGPWSDPDAALARWRSLVDDLLAGGQPDRRRQPTNAIEPSRKGQHRKPRSDFPLFPHATGRWAKKVRGKLHYFGKVIDDPQGVAALDRWLDNKDDLLAGRIPRARDGALTVADTCNRFLTHKTQLLESGELAQRTFDRYHSTCALLVDRLGRTRPVDDLQPDDFQTLRAQMAKRWGPVALGNEIQMVRSVFRFAYESRLIDKPIRFGPGFKKPSAKTLRMTRAAGGPKLFTPKQVHSLLKAATVNLRAMLLLGLNGGLGNTDLAELPIEALDLADGWLDYARTKTGIARRIPLWPETLKAIRAVLQKRREPGDETEAGLLFVGPRGKSYLGNHRGYRVTAEFNRGALKAAIEGRTFYDLRRTFQTVAEGVHDLVAVQSIMGHAPASGDMSAIYRQRVEDERLKMVAEHVRNWLFKDGEKRTKRKE